MPVGNKNKYNPNFFLRLLVTTQKIFSSFLRGLNKIFEALTSGVKTWAVLNENLGTNDIFRGVVKRNEKKNGSSFSCSPAVEILYKRLHKKVSAGNCKFVNIY